MNRTSIALFAAVGGALLGAVVPVALAQAPAGSASYVCTAVELPTVKGAHSPIPDRVDARQLPAGFRPVGGGSAGGFGGSPLDVYVIACREQ